MNPWLGALVVVLALGLSTGGGWAFTRLVLHLASRSSDAHSTTSAEHPAGAPGDPAAAPVDDGPQGPAARAALRGGTWIGLLERLATTGALLLGEPSAVAIVVAVKGLGRYPELREHPVASERFVVGTLASLTWAAAVGFVGRWLLTG